MNRSLTKAYFFICLFLLLAAGCQAGRQMPTPEPAVAPELQIQLDQAAAQAPFALLVPGELPDGFALAGVQITPGEQNGPYQALQSYRAGEQELRVVQSTLKFGADPMKAVSETSVRGVTAYYLVLNVGTQLLAWDEPDSSVALSGLAEEDLLAVAEGLRAHPGAALAQIPAAPAPASTPTPAPAHPEPTAGQILSPQENAAQVLTEFDISTEEIASPHGRTCTWKSLLAGPRVESTIRKYNNQLFTYVRVKCSASTGEVEWELVNAWTELGPGYALPALLGWDIENERLYFYDRIIPDGCQPLGGFQENLRRVDLANGAIEPIPLDGLNGISLSPDATRVIGYQGTEIGLISLPGGEQQRIPLEVAGSPSGWRAGNFTWSPDGESVLFVIQHGDACSPEKNEVRRLDLQTGQIRTLAEIPVQFVRIESWSEPGQAVLQIEVETWQINADTGELTKVAAP